MVLQIVSMISLANQTFVCQRVQLQAMLYGILSKKTLILLDEEVSFAFETLFIFLAQTILNLTLFGTLSRPQSEALQALGTLKSFVVFLAIFNLIHFNTSGVVYCSNVIPYFTLHTLNLDLMKLEPVV